MFRLKRSDLFSLEEYAVERSSFRAKVIPHRKLRQVILGEHISLHFEDRLTMQYQIQEMLRVERIFEPDAIQEELDTYNELIPDGTNWKATMLIEYEDPADRATALVRLRGIEDRVWVSVGGAERTYAIANEDMPRSNEEKTAAVHFLRFEFPTDVIRAMTAGEEVSLGVDDEELDYQVQLDDATRQALLLDLR